VNLMAVKLVKKSVVTVELIIAGVGALAMLIGLSLFY
jgi:hypothetical protein